MIIYTINIHNIHNHVKCMILFSGKLFINYANGEHFCKYIFTTDGGTRIYFMLKDENVKLNE